MTGRPLTQAERMLMKRARVFLDGWPASLPLGTGDLARALDPQTTDGCTRTLSKIAPHMEPRYVRRGDAFVRYGRTLARWEWLGQTEG